MHVAVYCDMLCTPCVIN